MGQIGPIMVCRIGPVQMPAAQGYISVQEFTPNVTQYPAHPGPRIGIAASRSTWIGDQWAPGQGGDTPGGGGAATRGETFPVDTNGWIQDGYVIPMTFSHAPGSVGAVRSRRGRA